MSAILAPGTSSPSRNAGAGTSRRARVWHLLALLLLGAQNVARAQEHDVITAVWQERRLTFNYDSAVAVYSCNALAARVASVLRAVGARDDIKARASNCDESTVPPPDAHINDYGSWNTSASATSHFPTRRPDLRQTAIVHIRVMMPVEVTDQVLAELKKDKEKRELVARVTANPAARFNDPVAFTAQRQPVTLSHRTAGLEPEECELIDQMSGSLLPQLGVRVIRRGYTCDPQQVSRIPPELDVEALVATPYATPQPAIPSGGKDDPGAPIPPAGDTKPGT